ncbi:unnamed protein product [Acanthoscelides obtectus]|uniref:monoamine oxidase n=1 Tax=Acanthoscelides obtectus TaxID=200917 RepID=A0A9P0JSJ5_ACAOB|nr:unnamed protein product [Acanthoscelides obtectus]CAK1661916.1 Probable flavin-containing monoamine oxidase A [Acanthoscelides obtectus]
MLSKNKRTKTFEIATHWINKDQHELLELLEKLETPFVSTVLQGSVIKEWNGKEICEHRLGMLSDLSFSEQLELACFLVKVETYCVNLEKTWDRILINKLASITFQEYINQNLHSDKVKCFIEYVVLITCAIPPDKISAFFYIFYCLSNRSLVDQMVSEKGTNRYRIKSSHKNLCERLVEKVDPNIIFFGEPVLEVGVSSKFVKVSTIYDEVNCLALIVAIPPSDLLKIKFKPKLPHTIMDSIYNTISRNVTTFIATYQEEFWRKNGFTGEVYVFDRNCSEGPIVICSGLTPEKPALVGRLYGGRPTTDKKHMYRDAVLNQLKSYFGKEALQPLDYYEKTWRENECMMPVWEVNNCEYIDCFRVPAGRIFWAGADTSFDWYGSLAGAVCSGIKAGIQVLYDMRPATLTPEDMDVLTLSKSDRRHRRTQYEQGGLSLGLYYYAASNWKKYIYSVFVLMFVLWALKKILWKRK